ncbi:MAG: formate dehydrogenase subunit gamma [Candidatus Abyssobacteria bacterium SURF_17]|uniref:Formate dehydrogenase subunit gamma n=1 Tax=Candidatus Abyssobacteria bacterium SURF_17 TaxID=2093361 RepID=A0A419FA22_9BACT|nr:MAG: formate dehydrogenase subunit gamma [Candidatus Abyssubacteria bacterium SURF_17]
MTSFEFTVQCAVCHPGGGPMELDRNGNRYDTYMLDPANEMTSGADNNFDGDYYKARWAETGVLEADCLICHLPSYDKKDRDQQVDRLNFKWAATAGAGFAEVSGAVKDGVPATVKYNRNLFDSDGSVKIPIVKEPPSRVCMQCHHETDWKKKGTAWTTRTDVHIRAGLRCVDCHPAGSNATDLRIAGKEVHQFAKGDDPGALVRDDLDNTMMSCEECHAKGHLGAPVPQHAAFPPLHLKKISCQTCHMPERQIKAALVQDSTVWNSGPFIPFGKRIWSYYGPDMLPWNFYGEKARFTSEFQPTAPYKPFLEWYKGKIYPLSKLYPVWVGIEAEGQTALGQPLMRQMVKMWSRHKADPSSYPKLSVIRDDNDDGYADINRPEEISAIIDSVTEALREEGATLEGKQVVFVNGDKLYRSPGQYRVLEKHSYEYSPYGSVFKLSHDVAPAKAALGSKGCTECHTTNSHFFAAAALRDPFTTEGFRITAPMHEDLGYSTLTVQVGAWRENILRPWSIGAFFIVGFLLILHYIVFGPKPADSVVDDIEVVRFGVLERVAHYFSFVSFAILTVSGICFLLGRNNPLALYPEMQKLAQTVHPLAGVVFAIAGLLTGLLWIRHAALKPHDIEWLRKLGGYLGGKHAIHAGRFNAGQKLLLWWVMVCTAVMLVTGIAMWFPDAFAAGLVRVSYTIHLAMAALFIIAGMVHFYVVVLLAPVTLKAIFTGRVPRSWLEQHHSLWVRKAVPKNENE